MITISSIEFKAFIRATLPGINDHEPRLIMFIRVYDEGTSPRVQCTICGRGKNDESRWAWEWNENEPMPEWLKPFFEYGMKIINTHNDKPANKGSILTSSLMEDYDLIESNAEYRGRMSTDTIEQWHEKNNFLGNEEFKDCKPYPYQVTYCAKTIHVWIQVTNFMWEHWVMK